MTELKPHHLNASKADITGNQGIGRYLFVTGSDERAQAISQHFDQVRVNQHPRTHHLYLGNLGQIEVGAISTGMGGPSADIIINELIMLGAKRLLRVGTAGSLQPQQVQVGEVVIATAAVRDDKASWDYIYPEYPAVASLPYLVAAGRALAQNPSITGHFGIVHSKSSLYAREYGLSLTSDNQDYMASMQAAGVLATEMECAQLFTLSSLANLQSGAILAIVGDTDNAFSSDQQRIDQAIEAAINLSIAAILEMYRIDTQPEALFKA